MGRCGVSVGSCEEALACLADDSVQHIQLPVNLLDYRWREMPRFEAAMTEAVEERGVTVHARSCFLQGTPVTDGPLWPEWAQDEGWPDRVLPPLDALVSELGRQSRADLCVAYARALPRVTHVLIGMRSISQLNQNLPLFDNVSSLIPVAMFLTFLPFV